MGPENKISDDALRVITGKIANGDQDAFRILFHHYAAKLILFSQSMLLSKEAATEVVDDVWVKIWKNRENLESIENLRIYLYTATKNTSLNYLSKKAKEMITEPFNDISVQIREEHCPEQQMITEEIFAKIHESVQDLPPRCKLIFKLVREDGLKYKEVAEILKISENTVDAQMVIAVRRIKEAVGNSFDFQLGKVLKKI